MEKGIGIYALFNATDQERSTLRNYIIEEINTRGVEIDNDLIDGLFNFDSNMDIYQYHDMRSLVNRLVELYYFRYNRKYNKYSKECDITVYILDNISRSMNKQYNELDNNIIKYLFAKQYQYRCKHAEHNYRIVLYSYIEISDDKLIITTSNELCMQCNKPTNTTLFCEHYICHECAQIVEYKCIQCNYGTPEYILFTGECTHCGL